MPIAREKMNELFTRWCLDNADAAAFLRTIAEIARLTDDVADGDAENPHMALAAVLGLALNTVHRNPFFRRHSDTLGPALAQAAMEWAVSEEWAKSSAKKTRVFGFVYRDGVERIAHLTALILGGTYHAAQVMVDLHAASHEGGETLEEWEAEHGNVRPGPA